MAKSQIADAEEIRDRLAEEFPQIVDVKIFLISLSRKDHVLGGRTYPEENKISVLRGKRQEIRSTLVHELAHILQWKRHRKKGHGLEFKRSLGELTECFNRNFKPMLDL